MSVGAGKPRGVRPLLARYALTHRQLLMEATTLGLVVALLVGITVSWWRTNSGLTLESRSQPSASPTPLEAAPPPALATSEGVAGTTCRPGRAATGGPQGGGASVPASSPSPSPASAIASTPASSPLQPPSSTGPEPRVARSATPPPSADDTPVAPPARPVEVSPATIVAAHAGSSPRPRPAPLDRPRSRPASAPPAEPPTARKEKVRTGLEPDRVLVTGADGSPLVARVERRDGDRSLVALPDGSLGWVSRAVPTDLPFVPWGFQDLRDARAAGVFGDLRAVESQHYFVLTEGSPAFARACATQLEDLYRGLIDAFRAGKMDVHAPEVPLVVVIFRDRESMMIHRRVDPNVRAYYEAYSNQIILHETSERDERTPDLAALRRPQSIAHEGVHQLLQNIGVQPRLSAWPPWLAEGLAEFFAPATTQPVGARDRFGAVNPFHMATLIDLNDPTELWARLSMDPGPATGGPVRMPPGAWIEHLVTREELGPTDYAMSWALTHHLARRRPDQLRNYIRQLARAPVFEPPSPDAWLDQFRRAFQADPAVLAMEVDTHVGGLEYQPLPYFAVPVQIDAAVGYPFRGVLISQSQVMIQKWLGELDARWGTSLQWGRAEAYPSRNQALQASEGWRNSSALSGPWPGTGSSGGP